MTKDVYTVSQVADKLGLSRRSTYRWIRRGLLPVVRVSESRIVVTSNQVRLIEAVLSTYGRKGIREGIAVAGS